jgi:class 3 adenylate cyclase/DNA-binding SARP family transcriptional activator
LTDRARHISLRAILFADLVGYSRRVSIREAETLRFVEKCFALFRDRCGDFGGEVVKTTGDGILAEFLAASQAVEYAVEMHRAVDDLQRQETDKARFRMGIHVGEVERIGADIYGHAVNIAARLVTLAKPGGVCISHEVYRHVRHDTPFEFVAGGVTSLRNIPEPVAIYHLAGEREEQQRKAPYQRLTVQTIDGFSVINAVGERARLRSDRVRALLGYLALEPTFGAFQDRVAALLWPDRAAGAARRALSECFRQARSAVNALTPGVLFRRDEQIGLESSDIEVDLIRITDDLARGTVHDLLIERPNWPETILLGTERASRLFRSWLEVTRHNWRARITLALEACLQRFEAAEPAARRTADALLALEPSHERAVQKLIQHHAENRNVVLAIRTFEQFAKMLRDRFEIAPGRDTVALVEALRRQEAGVPAARELRPEEARVPRIAMGGFEAAGVAGDEAYLISGFRNELIANLSRFREWVVLEMENGERVAAGRLADYVLQGSARRQGSSLGLFVSLSEAEALRVVWSETFEISVEGWFAAQRLLVRRIAARLQIYLSSDRLARTIADERSSKSDYGEWLRGEHLLSLWNAAAEDEAETIFGEVIARNPGFAPGYASLAGIYNVRHLIRPGSPLDAGAERRALPLAQRAVELDPLDSRNHLTVAWSSAMAGVHEHAAVHYELAASLNPSSPKLLLSCAQGLAFTGKKERARNLLREAFELAPFFLSYQWCYVASTRYMIADYEDAVEAAERGANATLDNPGWRAAALARLSRMEEARAAFAEQVEIVRQTWAGSEEPTPAAVTAWFLSAFPIGLAADRAKLRETMGEIVGASVL